MLFESRWMLLMLIDILGLQILIAWQQVSVASTGFGGQQFWELLRSSAMEAEVRQHYAEARSVLPKRGGTSLQVCAIPTTEAIGYVHPKNTGCLGCLTADMKTTEVQI